MRCGCPSCGIYMIQSEKGLQSGCICPNCMYTCNACMGTNPPLNAKELAQYYAQQQALSREEEAESLYEKCFFNNNLP